MGSRTNRRSVALALQAVLHHDAAPAKSVSIEAWSACPQSAARVFPAVRQRCRRVDFLPIADSTSGLASWQLISYFRAQISKMTSFSDALTHDLNK
jgi:hypothetical protein